MLLPIASVVVVGVAACAALGLLIVLFVRLSQRLEAMAVDVERIDRVLKDSTADVRSRLEESAREVEVMAAAVGKVESVEAEVGSLKTSFETHAPVLETVGSRIDAIETRVASLDERINEVEKLGTEGMAAVRAEWNEVEAMIEKSERQLAEVEAERTREADRLEELRTAVGSLRGTVEDKIEEQEDRLQALESNPQSQIANAAAGLDPLTGEIEDVEVVETSAIEPVRSPARAEDEPEEETAGARWVFILLLALMGLAVLAQWLRHS